MATSKSLGNNQIISSNLNKKTTITVTKRTVRFSKNVYQTHNIAGFSEGEIDIGTIPWIIIIVIFTIGYVLFEYMGEKEVSQWFLIAGSIGTLWNCAKPKHYGLLLTLNSGDKKLFVTTDKQGLQLVIKEIYDFIETDKETIYQISVSNSEVKGNLIQGYAGGNVSYRADD